jgi:hypothetical protein
MKKVVKLTENDLIRIINRVINEEEQKEKEPWEHISQSLSEFKSPRIKYDSKENISKLSWDNLHKVKGSKTKGGVEYVYFDIDKDELSFQIENTGGTLTPSPYGKSLINKVKELIEKNGFKYESFRTSIYVSYPKDLNMKNASKIVKLAKEILKELPRVKAPDANE